MILATAHSLFDRVDWQEIREWLSPAIAFASVAWAIRESRARSREVAARADDAKKYTQALETVIEYGRFVQHLEGVDKRVGVVSEQLERIAKRTADIADLASKQIDAAMSSLAKVSAAAMEVAQELTQIGRTALRAQRDSFRAHKQLVGEIGGREQDTWELPEYEGQVGVLIPEGSLHEKLLQWLDEATQTSQTIRADTFFTKYAGNHNIMAVAEELSRMEKEGRVAITKPLGPSSVITLFRRSGGA
jgi:methyl-accepting chemotaxis protein